MRCVVQCNAPIGPPAPAPEQHDHPLVTIRNRYPFVTPDCAVLYLFSYAALLVTPKWEEETMQLREAQLRASAATGVRRRGSGDEALAEARLGGGSVSASCTL